MNNVALEALYAEFRTLRSTHVRKQLDRVEALQRIDSINSDIDQLEENTKKLIDFAGANGADLEAIHQERIAMSRDREYDPLGSGTSW